MAHRLSEYTIQLRSIVRYPTVQRLTIVRFDVNHYVGVNDCSGSASAYSLFGNSLALERPLLGVPRSGEPVTISAPHRFEAIPWISKT